MNNLLNYVQSIFSFTGGNVRTNNYDIIKKILELRFHQFQRFFIDLELSRSVIILFFVVIPIVMYPYLLCLLPIVIILFLQGNRKDIPFLKLTGIPIRTVFMTEYIAICIPGLIAGIILHVSWIYLLIPYAILIAFLPVKKTSIMRKAHPSDRFIPISKTVYEWYSVIRKFKFYIYAFYCLLIVCGILVPNTIPILMVIILIMVASFYATTESFHILEAFRMGSDRFLIYKIIRAIQLTTISLLPFVLIYIIWPDFEWYVIFAIYMAGLVLAINAILVKYMLYEDGRDIKKVQGYVIQAVMISFVFPVVPVLTAAWFYWKARKRLKKYLYAFD